MGEAWGTVDDYAEALLAAYDSGYFVCPEPALVADVVVDGLLIYVRPDAGEAVLARLILAMLDRSGVITRPDIEILKGTRTSA